MGKNQNYIQAFMSPKYVQATNLLNSITDYTDPLGEKVTALIDEALFDKMDDFFKKIYETKYNGFSFRGQVCASNVEHYTEQAKGSEAEVILGVGGGRTMDVAKLVANNLNLSLVIIPTCASTDAPTSALAVMYTDTGEQNGYVTFFRDPDLVLVDNTLIASAPTRLLVAGMGDALSTFFEGRANRQADSTNNMEYKQTLAGYAIAKECYLALLRDGVAALRAAEEGVVTNALRNIIEVNTLLSGVGAECVGASGAHAFHDGFTILPACHNYLHGEKVAFGLICQLILENSPKEELKTVMQFAYDVGLPLCMEDLGVSVLSEVDARSVAKVVTASGMLAKECLDYDEELIYSTIIAANRIGKRFKENQK